MSKTNVHAENAKVFNDDIERVNWHDESLWQVRQKRDKAANALEGWETLREAASNIKSHTLSKLDEYLVAFEKKAIENGVQVHWAKDANEHNEIVLKILNSKNAKRVVKSKSMLTEECGLNEYLHSNHIEVIDTDLGERIIQLKDEAPSHIVMPAIHLKKEEIGKLFSEKLQTEQGNSDPKYLTEAARIHLRKEFLRADAALTGVNFGIAETGGIVICTNEGNADLGVQIAPLQIHSMGIEKIIPKGEHLAVFLRLLARSATGQSITIYSSHYHRPRANTDMHVILVDNGRSEILGKEKFRDSLKCIRCGACINTCPIYRRSGGHSYHATIPGPIGSILNPNTSQKDFGDLPFASSLCGSCTDVCPVKINIHEQLYDWRQELYNNNYIKGNLSLKLFAKAMARPKLYKRIEGLMNGFLNYLPRFMIYNRFNIWTKSRELPKVPEQRFRDWYIKNRKDE